MSEDFHFQDFTETNYARLLDLALERRHYVGLHEPHDAPDLCLWRHDIDMSPQRALALAALEASRGIPAVYYVFLHSQFYSCLDRPVLEILRRLLELGHELGLHFESEFYREDCLNPEEMECRLAWEARLLGELVGQEVRSYTIHNPQEGDPLVRREEVGGLVNGFAPSLRQRFEYCSDSNGYWRYQRLEDVLREPVTRPLCVLTHPVWWVERPLSPRERIQRALDGRRSAVARGYDEGMTSRGRVNVRGSSSSGLSPDISRS